MNYTRLLENLNSKAPKRLTVRRYSLAEMISESYKSLYKCKKDSNLQKLAEAHLADVRNNPTEIDRLSRQLCRLNHVISMVESNEIEDFDVLVPEEKYAEVEPKEEDLKESTQDESVEERADESLIEESSDLTDEEVEALTQHLKEMRKNKKVKESGACNTEENMNEAEVEYYQPTVEDAMKVVSRIKKKYGSTVKEQDYIDTITKVLGKDDISTDIIDQAVEKAGIKISEGKEWDDISLTEFAKKSTSKAFVRTFKKLDSKLREGTVLTRQESISLYKAANSAMTHLSVELEHNPEFLGTFKESVSLLSVDVDKLLSSLKEGKAPSIATMKSLAKFSEALLREDEEEEDLPPIEDEEDEVAIDPEEEEAPAEETEEESEEFDREYADARVELHKELADEHADSENPEIQDKLVQDAEEVINLPGITDEQVAEIAEEISAEDTEADDDEVEEGISPAVAGAVAGAANTLSKRVNNVGFEGPKFNASFNEDSSEEDVPMSEPGEDKCPKCNRKLTDAGECPACDHGEEDFGEDDDITDDEIEALKKYLTEMRKAKKIKESTKGRRLMRRK